MPAADAHRGRLRGDRSPAVIWEGGETVPEVNLGDPAPDFRLPASGNKEFSLSDFHGKRCAILAFYPFDWSPG